MRRLYDDERDDVVSRMWDAQTEAKDRGYFDIRNDSGFGQDNWNRYAQVQPQQQQKQPSTVQDWQQKMYSYSQYLNPYQDQIGQKVDAIMNRGPFEYNLDKDPAWQAYQKAYTREGERAYNDALAKFSARTGGLASSYAGQQAQQTYNGYMQQMTDKIPELYKLAYDMYSSDAARDINDLNALRNLGSDARAEWLDNYNLLGNNLALAQNERDYQTAQDTARLYAYGNGAPYEIGTGKGQYFVLNAAPGASMTGDDGSVWTKNADGSVTITRDGQTWSIAAPASGYSGGGRYSQTGDIIDYDSTRGKALVSASEGNPALAMTYLTSYWDNLGYEERFSLLRNAGYDKNTAMSLARDDGLTGKDFGAFASSMQTEPVTGSVYDQLAAAGVSDYGDAYEWLLRNGYNNAEAENLAGYYDPSKYATQGGGEQSNNGPMMTQGEWNRRKQSYNQYGTGGAEVANYDSYEEYADAYRRWLESQK